MYGSLILMSKSRYDKDPSDNDKKRYAKFLSQEEDLELITGYGRTYLRQKFIIQIMFPGLIFILGGAAYGYFLGENMAYGLLVGLILSILFSVFLTWMIKVSHVYLLTTGRVIIKEGIFNLKVQSAIYDKITHIEVDQGIMDRLFLHHGKVILNTAGGNQDKLILRYVEYPMEFKNILERLVHLERKQLLRDSGSTKLSTVTEYS